MFKKLNLYFALGSCFLITLSIIFADTFSSKLLNDWIWLPSSGNPVAYEIAKLVSSDDDWDSVDAEVPATTVEYTGSHPDFQGKQVVRYTLVSTKEESYQLRIRARDAAGNLSAWSIISDAIHISTAPGKPMHEE